MQPPFACAVVLVLVVVVENFTRQSTCHELHNQPDAAMNNDSAQDVKQRLTGQVSHMDSTLRSTLTDLRRSGSATMTDLKQRSGATVADIHQKGSSRVGPIVHKVSYNARLLWERYLDFTHTSPVVSAFLTIQLLLAAVPVLVFAGFMTFTCMTVAFFASCVVGTIAFFAACVLVPVLMVASAVGFSLFATVVASYLALGWTRAVRRAGLQTGTRQFLFGVERRVKREYDSGKVYALRAEDRLSEHTGQTKLEDFVPAAGPAA